MGFKALDKTLGITRADQIRADYELETYKSGRYLFIFNCLSSDISTGMPVLE